MNMSCLSFGILLAATLLAASNLRTPGAAPAALEAQITRDLKQVTSLELPDTAARLVKEALPSERGTVALAIARVVSELNAPALPSVIGAITRISPALSIQLATEAAQLQPKLRSQILAAAGAAVRAESRSMSVPAGQKHAAAEPADGDVASIAAERTIPDPVPTPGNGKKKGHYKRPQGP